MFVKWLNKLYVFNYNLSLWPSERLIECKLRERQTDNRLCEYTVCGAVDIHWIMFYKRLSEYIQIVIRIRCSLALGKQQQRNKKKWTIVFTHSSRSFVSTCIQYIYLSGLNDERWKERRTELNRLSDVCVCARKRHKPINEQWHNFCCQMTLTNISRTKRKKNIWKKIHTLWN